MHTSFALRTTNSAKLPCFHGGIAAHTWSKNTLRWINNKDMQYCTSPVIQNIFKQLDFLLTFLISLQ